MTAYRVVVAERKEILVVSILCGECGCEISIDAGAARVPSRCPSCERRYSPHIMSALEALGTFHRDAATAEEQSKKPVFRFHIRQAGDAKDGF
jgi:hypothetical protein